MGYSIILLDAYVHSDSFAKAMFSLAVYYKNI